MNFVDCESFLQSNSPDILPVCETNLDDSIDSANFFVRGYLPSTRKDSTTHMHGLTVYVKERHPFAQDFSLENMFLTGLTSLSFLLLFLLTITLFVFMHGFSTNDFLSIGTF